MGEMHRSLRRAAGNINRVEGFTAKYDPSTAVQGCDGICFIQFVLKNADPDEEKWHFDTQTATPSVSPGCLCVNICPREVLLLI
jgi:hypothetical protein